MSARLRRLGTLAAMAAGGAVFGGAAALLGDRLGLDLAALGPWDGAALAVALGLSGLGVATLLASFETRLSAAFRRNADPLEPEERRLARLQGWTLLLTGPLLAAAPVAALSLGAAAAAWTYAGVVAAFAVQSALNWRLWRAGDELVRRTVVEAGAATFWLGQAALFLFAAAERLGLVAAADGWSLLVALMALHLVVSSVVAVRRGLGGG